VQTGYYRTGTYPFAFQHYGIVPDVVTLAKGLGAGMPIGAIAARGVAAEVFVPGDHGSTFGGGPLAVAAANATLDELAAMDIGQHVAEVGSYLQGRLRELPLVTDVRGRGLMVGVELSEPVAEGIVNTGLEVGLVLNNIGPHILRFLPPLVCTKKDVDTLIERLQGLMG
jgi:acetylornithine aminotransferase